jgi:hypothetical protein
MDYDYDQYQKNEKLGKRLYAFCKALVVIWLLSGGCMLIAATIYTLVGR